MSHDLTQPEEIDLIWAAVMASHDMDDVDTPILDLMRLSKTIRGTERYELNDPRQSRGLIR